MKPIIITLSVTMIFLAGCFESEDAGTARANSAATQNQMDEMAGLVSQLIDQNAALQETAIQATHANSGANIGAWVLLTVVLVLAVLALALAPLYMRVLQDARQPSPPVMLAQPPTALPQASRLVAIDEQNRWLYIQDAKTGQLLEAKRENE